MSDLDPQTRDLRAALRATEPGARAPERTGPPVVWIVVALLVAVAVVAYFGWGRNLIDLSGAPSPTATAPVTPVGG